ncbi:MAG: DNA cytosine methyltransferase [Verrucomicrobia bacterium]|nr:DNA cytosine methyltransferase [Verrucomicrobiota bacterium]
MPVDFWDDEGVLRARLRGELLKQPKRYRLIDAFAGAGGKTLGFSEKFGHPFVSVWANDIDEDCCETYNANFGSHAVCGDIFKVLDDPNTTIPKADVVIGGPPCQGFSNLNQQKNLGVDPRRALWRGFIELIRRAEPEVFVMENVPPLLKSFEYREIAAAARKLGYLVRSQVLCAADYGVSQTRNRAFVVGCLSTDPAAVFPPKKTHYRPADGKPEPGLFRSGDRHIADSMPWRTVRDAIEDLPRPTDTVMNMRPSPLDLHFGRTPEPLSLERYMVVHKEGMNRFDLQRLAPHLTPACWIRKKTGGTDLFGRMWWDRPSFTVRTEFFKPEKGRYLHPEQHRPITHREAARLQSFPDDFIFKGSKIAVAKQIGNAVPPLLAARVADAVYALLLQKSKRQ